MKYFSIKMKGRNSAAIAAIAMVGAALSAIYFIGNYNNWDDCEPSSIPIDLEFYHSKDCSEDGRLVCIVGETGSAFIQYDGKNTVTLTEGDELEGVERAKVSPDETRVATLVMGKGHNPQVWDAHSGKPLFVLRGHQDTVVSLGFSLDGKYAVTSSRDGTAKVWNAWTGSLIESLNTNTRAALGSDFSNDGKYLRIAPSNNSPQYWKLRRGAGLFGLMVLPELWTLLASILLFSYYMACHLVRHQCDPLGFV